MKTYDQFVSRLIKPNRFLAISVTNDPTAQRVLVVERKRSELLVVQRFEFESIDQLLSLTSDYKGYCVVLSLDTKSVISQSELPDYLNDDEFVVQNSQHGQQDYFAFARMDYLRTLVQRFKDEGFPVIHIGLSIIPSLTLMPFLKHHGYQEPVIGRFKIGDQSMVEADAIERFDLDSQYFDSNEIYAYSGIAHYLSQGIERLQLWEYLNYIHQRWSRRLLVWLPALLFVLLLINSFVFLFLDEKTKELNEIMSGNEIVYKETMENRQKIERYKMILNVTSERSISHILDDIGKTVPKGMNLTELIVFPSRISRRDNELSFDDNTILIRGEFRDATTYSNWLYELETVKWVSDISDQVLDHDTKEKKYRFKITLGLS